MLPKFSQIEVEKPDLERLSSLYETFRQSLSNAETDPWPTIEQWDQTRRNIATWQNVAELNFERETTNEEYISVRKHSDEIAPSITELDVEIKKLIMEGPHRSILEAQLGHQAFALWRSEILAFDPKIKNELTKEASLSSAYSSLLASAKLSFQGEEFNHEGIDQFKYASDRQTRHDSFRVKWEWFEDQANKLDSLFGELVMTRTSMAKTLGYENYLELGYLRRCRVDYGVADVQTYREEVLSAVVPFCQRLIDDKRDQLKINKVMFWDEAIHSPSGNPTIKGGYDWLIDQAKDLFNHISDPLGNFFDMMLKHELLDLKNRANKGGGGFCTDFPKYGLPYIFANFNGSADDVRVFTHEMGHAFQGYCSRNQKIYDYVWPTYESCEIHSMGLEFLTFPEMHRFFGEDADQFCREHLIDSILFLPYGVAVDHFQHLVYANPSASASDRHDMWKEVEAKYLPWRDYGDLRYPAMGGRWQLQRHIFMYPLYYIDYTLALACALQLWQKSCTDYPATLKDYHELCHLGGRLPFQELTKSVDLQSPLQSGVLSRCIDFARRFLT